MSKNHYELLGLKPGVSLTEIKRSYRKLARKYHPDSGAEGSSKELFLAITTAYDTLSSPEKRQIYDKLHSFDTVSAANDDGASEEAKQSEATHKQSEGKRAYKRQRPADGSFGKRDEKLQSQPYAGPNSSRFSGTDPTDHGTPDGERSTLFGRLSNFVRPSTKKVAGKAPSARPSASSTGAKDIRGPREYYFTIDALESIRGATRELALRNEDGTPRVIRVKIPPAVRPGATLKIPISDHETARIHVTIVPHPLVSRENDDVTVRIPITLLEALNGVDLEVPSPQGPVRVRIPPKGRDDKKLRVKGRGLKGDGAAADGDLYVDTYIVLPTSLTEVAKQAAQALEAHYNTDIRRDLPRQLN